eukprot:scaffold38380_cov58-Phaeocystis_antarctica.AAC.2
MTRRRGAAGCRFALLCSCTLRFACGVGNRRVQVETVLCCAYETRRGLAWSEVYGEFLASEGVNA